MAVGCQFSRLRQEGENMKVLVIDDELHVYQAIQLLICWEKYGVDEILYASDGGEGIKKVREFNPEIIFTDMEMHSFSGIDFLKQLRREGFENQVIVISGYKDYNYMKAAIVANSVDYISKPIDRDELEAAINRAVENLENRYRLAKKADRDDTIIRANMLRNLINFSMGRDSLNYEMAEITQNLNPNDGKLLVKLLILKTAGSYKDGTIPMDGSEIKIKSAETFSIDSYLKAVVVQCETLVSNTFSELDSMLNKYIRRQYIGTVWKVVDIIEDLQREVGVLKEWLLNEVYIGKLLYNKKRMETHLSNDVHDHAIIGVEFLLKEAINNKDKKAVAYIVDEFCEGMQHKRITLSQMQIYTMEINFIICNILQSSTERVSENDWVISEWICDLEEWKHNIKDRLFQLCEYSYSNTNNRIIEVNNYLKKHFNQKIDMIELSREFGMSPQYLSKRYKEKFKETIGETIKQIRMEKSLQYLKYTEIPVAEIAWKVGFEDANYFSKSFKKQMGMSPIEMRKKLRDEHTD